MIHIYYDFLGHAQIDGIECRAFVMFNIIS